MVDGERNKIPDDFLTLARLALGDRPQDVALFLNRFARRVRQSDPDGSEQLTSLVRSATGRSSALRREAAVPVPVDADSRLHLLRIEQPVGMAGPVFTAQIEAQMDGLVKERRSLDRLSAMGLQPTRSALFVGSPGVGKTMTARWLASELGLPLLILDLSAVMSSFLGRTGNNVRAVLDYAKGRDCVLLLDELDAIAKRRDDATEVGELKRLVTVLLQEIDEWPASSMLLAATNHPELLDPAIWRRFDLLVEFPRPSREGVVRAIRDHLGDHELGAEWVDVLSILLADLSYSDIQKQVVRLRRACALNGLDLDEEVRRLVDDQVRSLSHNDRLTLAERLAAVPSISQRAVSDMTGVSRVTIRKRTKTDA